MKRLAFIGIASLAVGYILLGQATLSYGTVPEQAEPVELATSTDASYNWAGYVAKDGLYSAVSATWIVPQVSYPAGAHELSADATWVGIGGVVASDLIQVGTQALVDKSGDTLYQAWYEMLPDVSQPLAIEVHPGDSVSASLTYLGNDRWHISFINNTTGDRVSLNETYNSSLSSAEWVEEMPMLSVGEGSRSALSLDNFGTLSFNAASTVKDGKAVTLSQAGATPLSLSNFKSEILAAPSVLSSAGAFSVTRTSATSDTPPRRVRVIIIGS